jgi:uncharacterized protein (TIGR03790 family)
MEAYSTTIVKPVLALAFWTSLAAPEAFAAGPENVLVVVNDNSPVSRTIGEYYARRRSIPAKNICRLRTSDKDEVARAAYDSEIAAPVANCLRSRQLVEQTLYIVVTLGLPLRVSGREAMDGDIAAVDSELALLYTDIHRGQPHPINGMLPNPFFGQRSAQFGHPQFPMYLVTRLAAYDFQGVKAIIDKSMAAKNRGKFVIDLKPFGGEGNGWLEEAAMRLPKERVVVDRSSTVLYDQKDVIGYASWGSNDANRKKRFLGNQWLPGAVATEFVSTDGRTFQRPSDDWNISDWKSSKLWFAGSPQTMTADFLLEGATGASGHVAEPYLMATPRPEFLLPAYFSGRNLAESFYMSIRFLSWQNIVVGDPLCSLGPPQ